MKTYTIFLIPKRKFPEKIVIKRWRGEQTDDKLGKRGYKHFAYIDRKTKREALLFARSKYLLERKKPRLDKKGKI